jgi:hypothetical protein
MYKPLLSLPDPVDLLPVTQTIQYPASAINTDKGSNDGNWQVFMNLLEQDGVPDEQLEEEIILVHRDLATKERIDGLRKMCTIESSAKNHLGFAVVAPSPFHLKMQQPMDSGRLMCSLKRVMVIQMDCLNTFVTCGQRRQGSF